MGIIKLLRRRFQHTEQIPSNDIENPENEDQSERPSPTEVVRSPLVDAPTPKRRRAPSPHPVAVANAIKKFNPKNIGEPPTVQGQPGFWYTSNNPTFNKYASTVRMAGESNGWHNHLQ